HAVHPGEVNAGLLAQPGRLAGNPLPALLALDPDVQYVHMHNVSLAVPEVDLPLDKRGLAVQTHHGIGEIDSLDNRLAGRDRFDDIGLGFELSAGVSVGEVVSRRFA